MKKLFATILTFAIIVIFNNFAKYKGVALNAGGDLSIFTDFVETVNLAKTEMSQLPPKAISTHALVAQIICNYAR
jgi:hypothetical protein